MVDFLAYWEEFVVIVLSVVAFYLLIRFRTRVLSLLTGDDRVHTDAFDGCWYTIFRCCGLCTGDWTKSISCCPCWDACGMQNQNLVDTFGRWSGMLQWDVRVYNITVGDLPHDGPAYYYVSFEVGEHPPQCTAVSSLTSPKLLQFNGECTLRVRHSSLDNDVRVVVKEMRTLGSWDVCEMFVRPDRVVEWATYQSDHPMRFQMNPIGSGESVFLPGWILLTFEVLKPWEDNSAPFKEAAVTVRDRSRRDQTFQTVEDFKTHHPLMNVHGIPVREPSEADASHFQYLRRMQNCTMGCFVNFLILVLLGSVCFRMAVMTCYREYKRVLVLHLHGVEFPTNWRTREWVLQRCGYTTQAGIGDQFDLLRADLEQWKELLSDATWKEYIKYVGDKGFYGRPPEKVPAVLEDYGGEKRIRVDPNATACSPLHHDVVQSCYNLPIGSRDPWMLSGVARCDPWTCRYRMLLVPFTLVEAILVIALLVSMCLLHRRNMRSMQHMKVKLVEEAAFAKGGTLSPDFADDDGWGLCCGTTSRSRRPAAWIYNHERHGMTHVPAGRRSPDGHAHVPFQVHGGVD